MPGKQLFEYAVIRVMPKVEREEFLNVGVVLYCKEQQFLQAKISINKERLLACCTELDFAELEENLQSLERICTGTKDSGPIGMLDLPSRFRWLTAARSTVIQTSKVHPGFCTDPLETLTKLFEQLVL